MENIKDRIISKFPSLKVVAEICGLTSGAVSQWKEIPSKHQQTLLLAAPDYNVNLTPDEFFDLPIKKSKRKR